MGKILSLVMGVVLVVLGLILFVTWNYELMFIVRGVLPGILLFAGVLAIVAGKEEYKDWKKSKDK